MSPPPFADLGKSARDLFGKGFHHGLIKIDSTTKSGNNVEFKTATTHNISSEKIIGNVEVKYSVPQYGCTVTEKWSTDNKLGTTIEVKDQFRRGSKVTFDLTYTPTNGKRSALIKTEWATDFVKVNADANVVAGPVFNVSAVGFLQPNFYVGGLLKFDVATKQLKNHSFAIGHRNPEYTLHSYVNDGQEFGASLYHQVNKAFEIGSQLAWNSGGQNTNYSIASKYKLNKELTMQGKVDNNANVALSATHSLSDAVKLTLSTHFGLTKPEPQKFGVAVEYKPGCCHC